MLTIRLTRIGKKNQPSFRIIISDKSKNVKSTYLEKLGFYNPRVNPKIIQLNEERIKYWISKGAETSPTVHNILIDKKIISGPKKKATTLKKKRLEKMAKKAEGEKKKPEEKVEAEKREENKAS